MPSNAAEHAGALYCSSSDTGALSVTADVVCELSPVRGTAAATARCSPDAHARVEERLLECGRAYEARRQEARRQRDASAEAAAEAAMTRAAWPSPQRGLFVPSHATAEAARQRRMERHAALAEARAAPPPGAPSILPTSRAMALAARQRCDGADRPIADLLAERQQHAQRRIAERRRAEAAQFSFCPAVSARARSVTDDRPVVERLTARPAAPLADVTNRAPPAAPVKVLSAGASASPAYERLYTDAATRRATEAMQARLAAVQAASDAFRPRTDAVSSLLVAQRGDTARERLLQPRTALDPVLHAGDEEAFAPRRSAAPPQRAAFANFSVVTRASIWQQRRSERLREAAAEREAVQMRECTFHPRTRQYAQLGPSPPQRNTPVCVDPLADLIDSADDLLRRVDSTPPSPSAAAAVRQRLEDSVPADVLAVLEQAEHISAALRGETYT